MRNGVVDCVVRHLVGHLAPGRNHSMDGMAEGAVFALDITDAFPVRLRREGLNTFFR